MARDIDIPLDPYNRARCEHAFMLRLEGLTFEEIGARIGVSRNRAWQCQEQFKRYMRFKLILSVRRGLMVTVEENLDNGTL
jgi:hypothetical protein